MKALVVFVLVLATLCVYVECNIEAFIRLKKTCDDYLEKCVKDVSQPSPYIEHIFERCGGDLKHCRMRRLMLEHSSEYEDPVYNEIIANYCASVLKLHIENTYDRFYGDLVLICHSVRAFNKHW